MALTPDVLVLGAGMVGASIAHGLTVQGARVVLVERDHPDLHAGTWSAAGQVHVHDSDPARARLAALAFDTFAHWSDAVGGDCGFRRTGHAFLAGAEQAGRLADEVRSSAELGADVTEMAPHEFADMHPCLDLTGVAAVAHEPHGGYADPVRATLALRAAARAGGALILSGPSGGRLRRSGDRVTGVDLGELAFEAGQVVLAAGGWSTALLGTARLPLRAGRTGLAVADDPGVRARCPLPAVTDRVSGARFRPDGRDRILFEVPLEYEGGPQKVLDGRTEPDPERTALAQNLVGTRLRGLAGARRITTGSAVDGYTPDGRALIGPVDGSPGLYLATGFNGDGFRTAPAVGRSVAAELTDGGSRPELEPFRPGRFEGRAEGGMPGGEAGAARPELVA